MWPPMRIRQAVLQDVTVIFPSELSKEKREVMRASLPGETAPPAEHALQTQPSGGREVAGSRDF